MNDIQERFRRDRALKTVEQAALFKHRALLLSRTFYELRGARQHEHFSKLSARYDQASRRLKELAKERLLKLK